MGYSKEQEKVLSALSEGKQVKMINDKHYIGEQVYRSTTFGALQRRGAVEFRGDKYFLTESGKRAVGENLTDHRPNHMQFRWFDNHHVATYDIGQCDYAWWDKARRGAVAGLQLSGIFIKAIASKKAAWVLGQAPQFIAEHPETKTELNEWFQENHSDILLAMEESAVMGDYYIVVNPDETVTILPPNVIEPIVDEQNYSKQIGWRIVQTFSHPQKPWMVQTITDEYYYDKRVITMTNPNGTKGVPKTFPNLTGLLPVIHVPNNRRGGEAFGHPEAEALVQILHHYGQVLDVATEGNLRQGRPTPTFEKLGTQENLNAFLDAFARTETRTLDDGTTETYKVIEFSSDQVVYLGEDGTFKYASPGLFTADTLNILQILFYLVVQYTEIPEFVWGGAIASSKASAESQLEPFVKWAEKEQGRAEKWLKPLITYVRALKSLYNPKVRYKENEKVGVKWMPLVTNDGKLTLEAIKVALTVGRWKPEWVVPYMPLDIDNPEEIINGIIAQEEEERRRMNGEDEPFNQNLNDAPNEDSPKDENPDDAEAESVMENIVSEAHTGVMVAFELPVTAAAALAVSARQSGLEPVPPEDMHITLAFLDDRDQLESSRKAIERAVKSFAAKQIVLSGKVGGIGRFNASNTSDGMDVIYASFDAPLLPEFRQKLVEAIEKTGVEISRAHGFTPHITLAYVEKGSALPNLALEATELNFGKVTLYWGDERVSYDLKVSETLEAIA